MFGSWSLTITPTPPPLRWSLNLYQPFTASLLSEAREVPNPEITYWLCPNSLLRKQLFFHPLHLCLMGNWGHEEQIRKEPVLGVVSRAWASSASAPPLLTKGMPHESLAQALPHQSGPLPSATSATTSSSLSITHLSTVVSPHWVCTGLILGPALLQTQNCKWSHTSISWNGWTINTQFQAQLMVQLVKKCRISFCIPGSLVSSGFHTASSFSANELGN